MEKLASGSHARYVLVVLVALALSIPALGQNAGSRPAVTWQPTKLVNGSPVLFEISAATRVKHLAGSWMGHPVSFFPARKLWIALAGIPVETAPGFYDLKLTETFLEGKTLEFARKVKVSRAVYPKITVSVAKQFTEPNSEQLHTINADKQIKEKVFATETAQRLWAGSFVPPVSAAVSDVFGTARVFNQEVQSRHLGMDYAVAAGTPVHAVNRGTVILARDLYFEGGFVVIDHGQGLFSLYLHLSDFKVKEGDLVEAGQLIALSGGSGRATGPHLHLAVRWQGIYLNPATLLNLKIPTPASNPKFVPNS
jgi:murein DD-endopeptidase MepM/ murein hydrolase activator NlpD